jgi:DNA-binding GntR family transcriptional regulator
MSSIALKQRALYLDVAELLRQRIYNRELEPGAWIDELRIAQELGISRTPLREALKVLASEGLVTMKVRRGAYVTEVSPQDLQQVYELLSLLESDAARVVADTADDAVKAELHTLHTKLTHATNDTRLFFEINEQFHMRLLELANNPWRIQVVNDLRKVMKVNRQTSLFKTGRVQASLQEHQAVLDAIRVNDAATAQASMRAHFNNGLAAAQ